MRLIFSVAALFSFALVSETVPEPPKRVVILYDERVELPGLSALDASMVRTLNRSSAVPPQIYREPMDLSRFGSAEYLAELRQHLRSKYTGKPIDVVVAVMGPALDFVLAHGAEIFPKAAIVFCGIDRTDLKGRVLPDNVTGVLVKRRFRPTVELALRLHPQTRRVIVVGGTSDFDRRLIEQARQEIEPLGDRVDITFLAHLPLHSLLAELRTLPAQTIVLYTTTFRDGAGQAFIPHHVAQRVAEASSVPVYASIDQYLGRGIVGGHLYSLDAHGEAAATQVLRVLARDPPAERLIEAGISLDMFDWRQIQRWRIDPALLPSGAEIRFREPTAWDQYRGYILGAAFLALLQAVIIIALIVERARRQQGQKRYALASASGAVGVWEWNLETDKVYADPILKSMLGYADHEIGNHVEHWSRLIHPGDLPVVRARAQETIDGDRPHFEMEHRMLHRDGSIRWFLGRGAVRSSRGRPIRMIGTDTDITDRKLAEQKLEATRAELTRVARLTALGEFAASVAHEVRQPLTTITLNAETCLHWLNDKRPNIAAIREALVDIMTASRRADELIDRNRELFRMRAVSKEPLDINRLIQEVVVLAKPRLDHCQVNVTTSFAASLPAITGDRIELQQVLLNLIANAIDATDQLPPRQRHVAISTSIVAGEVTIAVRDNGVGLRDVDMDQLFKLSYTTKAKGTGIGLSLCRSIIEAHGGSMWARPNAGAGAAFCFTLAVPAPPAIPVERVPVPT